MIAAEATAHTKKEKKENERKQSHVEPLIVHWCLLQTKAAQQDNPEVEVARCSKGQYFGELALVTNKPRAASVYAVGDTKCLGMLQMMVYFPLFTSRGDDESSIFPAEHYLALSNQACRCHF